MRLLATITVLSIAAGAGAQTIEDAERLYQQGAIEGAARAFHSAVDGGGLDPTALARAHWHLGVLSTITGASAEAERAFSRALSLDPNLRVPDELPPEAQATYRDLQRSARRIELVLHVERVSSDRDSRISVRLRHAPPDFARTLRARSAPQGSPPWISEAAIEEGGIDVPAAAWRGSDRLTIDIDVVDLRGNVIASGSTSLRATPPAPAASLDEEPSSARSPWPWVGVAAGVVGVVGVVLTAVLLSRREADIVGGNIDVTRDRP